MEEVWKAIEGYEGLYQISNLGRIKSLARLVKGRPPGFKPIKERMMRCRPDKDGYLRVALCLNSNYKVIGLHQLLARHFVPNPNGNSLVCHKNGNNKDNRVENLYWGTIYDNAQDSLKHGTMAIGERSNLSTLNLKQVRVIKHIKNINPKVNQAFIGRVFGVKSATISAIYKGRNWKQVII